MRRRHTNPIISLAITISAIASLAVRGDAQTRPAAHADGGDIISSAEYRLPPYDSLTESQHDWLGGPATRAAYDSARRDARHVLRRVRYASDGLGVVAYTYLPRSIAAGERRPIIVYARGSYIAGDLAPVFAPLMRRLALAGFVVVAPQYRGSDGGDGQDELGGADVADVHNAIRLARRLPGVDSTRVFLYGESRGGMMVYQVLRDGAPVRAAAVVGAFTDLDSLLAGDPRSARASSQLWPTYERDRESIALRRSAARWAEQLNTPLLLLHGGADQQVSPRQAMRVATNLDARKVPYELRIFAGMDHTLSAIAAERDSTVAAWFTRWGQPSASGARNAPP